VGAAGPIVEELSREALIERVMRLERELQERAAPAAPAAEPGKLVRRWTTRDGWTIATLGWQLVPGYDYQAASEGLSTEARRQEIDIDWTATRGKVVYHEYNPKLHEALEPLTFDPRRPLHCGWDFGAHEGGTPAWVPTQLNSYGQWLIFPGIAPLEDQSIGTYEFGQLVADHLQREYAAPNGLEWRQLKLIHFGDPNGNQRPPRVGQSPREMATHFERLDRGIAIPLGMDENGEMRYERRPGFGFKIMPGPVNISERLDAVRARLSLLLPGGLPAIVVDPRATVIRDAFSGGYVYDKRADGSYDERPKKDFYSHSMDALAYVANRLFMTPEEDDDDRGPSRRPAFRCQAAGRMG
jgi:hypothetical protein